jgi:polyhydroxyalkanoate synthesis regulator phasin
MKEIDINIFYIVCFFSAALGSILVAVFTMYLRLVKRYLSLKDENDRQKKEVKEAEEQQLTKASEEAKQIIAGAYAKAQELVKVSSVFNDAEKAKLQTALTALVNEEIKEYRKVLDEAGKVSISAVERLSRDVKDQITPELGNIKETIEKQIKNASEETKVAISSAYAIVEKEVDDYKKKMLTEIDKLTLSVVKELSQKVLGKTISTKEQEDMVISALEEAKKQRII